MQNEFASMQNLALRTKWTPDKDYPNCTRCFVQFGLTTRRHHCRHCGQVLCAHCSPHMRAVPHMAYLRPVRLCRGCLVAVLKHEQDAKVDAAPMVQFEMTDEPITVVDRLLSTNSVDALRGINVFVMHGTALSVRALAAALIRAGADVYLGAANIALGKQVAKIILDLAGVAANAGGSAEGAAAVDRDGEEDSDENSPSRRIHVMLLDCSDLASVRQCAADFSALALPLDALVLNAQILGSGSLERTATDNFERVFQFNVLAPFLFAHLLEPALRAAPVARVLHATSAAHSFSDIDLQDLEGVSAYSSLFGQWKHFAATASMTLSFASALDWRYRSLNLNITSNSFATGVAVLESAVDPASLATALARRTLLEPTSPAMSASTAYAIGLLAPNLPSGRYFVNGRPTNPPNFETTLNPQTGRRLWVTCARLTRLTGDVAKPPTTHGIFASPPTSPPAPVRTRPAEIDNDDAAVEINDESSVEEEEEEEDALVDFNENDQTDI
jgi:NAD(P)-dependent dehydrogenase (short-subunit alcohol dehydrogenase family)